MSQLRANDSKESIQASLHGMSQVEQGQVARTKSRRSKGGAQTSHLGVECVKYELANASWLSSAKIARD